MPIISFRFEKFKLVDQEIFKEVFKQTKCDAVKLESNGKNFNILRSLVVSGMPVMGHIGYTPQYKRSFKPQGFKRNEQEKLVNEAIKIEKAGAFAIVLECINFNRIKGGKSFDLTSDWFDQLLREIGQIFILKIFISQK